MNLDPGWYSDPYFRKRERYWDGRVWTDQCRAVEVLAEPSRSAQSTRTTEPEQSAGTPGARTAQPTATTSAAPSGSGARSNGASAAAAAEALATKLAFGGRTPAYPDDTGVVPVTTPKSATDTAAFPAVAPGAGAAGAAGAPPAKAPRTPEPVTEEVPVASSETPTMPVVPPDVGVQRRIGGAVTHTSDASAPEWTPEPWPWDAEGAPPASAAVTAATSAGARKRRLLVALAIAVVLVVVGVVAYFLVGGGGNSGGQTAGGGPGSGGNAGTAVGAGLTATPSAAQALAAAAQKSTGQKTVLMNFDVKLVGAGQGSSQQVLSGTGGFFLGSDLGIVTLNLPGGGQAQAQRMIFDGPTLYLDLAGVGQAVPGKTWASATITALPSSGPGSTFSEFVGLLGNPAAMVNRLRAGPATVAPLGSSKVHGTSVKAYAVTFASSSSGRDAESGTSTGAYVYVAPDGLLQRVVIPTDVGVSGQHIKEKVVVTFTHYGTLLYVAPPPPSQVVPLAQYQAADAYARESTNADG